MIVFCVFAGVWSFCVHVRNDYKKQNKQIWAVHLCFFSCMNALLHIHVCAGVK